MDVYMSSISGYRHSFRWTMSLHSILQLHIWFVLPQWFINTNGFCSTDCHTFISVTVFMWFDWIIVCYACDLQIKIVEKLFMPLCSALHIACALKVSLIGTKLITNYLYSICRQSPYCYCNNPHVIAYIMSGPVSCYLYANIENIQF